MKFLPHFQATNVAAVMGAGGVVPVATTFTDSTSSGTDGASFTFSTRSFGTAAANRKIVVIATGRAAGATLDISGITINGGAADPVRANIRNTTSNTSVIGMYIADVPSGTTGDVVVTFNESSLRCGICIYAMTGAASSTASSTNGSTADDPSAAVTIPANGNAIAGAYAGAGTTSTPTGVSEDADFTVESSNAMTCGHVDSVAGGATTVTFDWLAPAAGTSAGIMAAWGP